MKAYVLSVHGDDDQGQASVFSDTAKEAKKKFWSTDLEADSYIDIRVKRAPYLDHMENLSEIEIELVKWRNGWHWFDYATPQPDETTDEEFYEWHKDNFGRE